MLRINKKIRLGLGVLITSKNAFKVPTYERICTMEGSSSNRCCDWTNAPQTNKDYTNNVIYKHGLATFISLISS
jgi:hypothetical protein